MTCPVTICVLIITALVTFIAFRRPDWKERLIFNPYEILRQKQYERMLTSGLIHSDWRHFLFNAFSFFSFGNNIELIYGPKVLLLVYVSSILGGSLLSLIIHRHHEYRALGASGGVCGVIFASIFLVPGGSVPLFPLMIPVPAYIYAMVFLVFSFIGHRRQKDNIGHDAHLGGAVIGLLVATALYPQMIFAAPWMFATVMALSVAILMVLVFDPAHLLEHRLPFTSMPKGDERSREYEENRRRNQEKAEIDRLLDKVAKKGMKSLSSAEQSKLKQLSGKIYGHAISS